MAYKVKCEELLNELKNQMASLTKTSNKFTRQCGKIETEIVTTFDTLCQILSERKSFLIATLSDIINKQEFIFQEISKSIENDITEIESHLKDNANGHIRTSLSYTDLANASLDQDSTLNNSDVINNSDIYKSNPDLQIQELEKPIESKSELNLPSFAVENCNTSFDDTKKNISTNFQPSFNRIRLNANKRKLQYKCPELTFYIDSKLISQIHLIGYIEQYKSIIADKSISKASINISKNSPDFLCVAPAESGDFYVFDATPNLIHLVNQQGECLNTLAIHNSIQLWPINCFHWYKGNFYITPHFGSRLYVFDDKGHIQYLLNNIGNNQLASPHGLAHTSHDQLVIANTAGDSILLCQEDLAISVSLQNSIHLDKSTKIRSPKFIAINSLDWLFTIPSNQHCVYILTLEGELLYSIPIRENSHPIQGLSVTLRNEVIVYTSLSYSNSIGSMIGIYKPDKSIFEKCHLRGLNKKHIVSLTVTNDGELIVLLQGSMSILLVSTQFYI